MLHSLTSQRVKDYNQFIHPSTIRDFFHVESKVTHHHFGIEICDALDFVMFFGFNYTPGEEIH